MFFDQLISLCEEKNTTPTKFVTEILHLSSSKVTAWKNGSIPKYEILNAIASYFDVSVGTLFDGRCNNIKSLTADEQELLENYNKLTDTDKEEVLVRAKELANETDSEEDSDKQRLLKMYDLLTPMEKGEILGELKAMTKKRNPDIHIQTVRIVARSTDDTPPRMVTGDFSDILNAPDATDEY